MPAFEYGRNQLLLMVVGLYLVQGITVGLVLQAFPVLLREAGVSLSLISLFSFAALPWVGKFFWCTCVDNYYWQRLGYRRSWIIPAHFLLIALLAVLAFCPPYVHNIIPLFVLIMLLSFTAATLDIATDGLAAQHFHGRSLVWVNAFQVTGVMCGMLLGGGGVMIMAANYGYQPAILALAGVSLLCLLPVLYWCEPPVAEKRREKAALRAFFLAKGFRQLLPIAVLAAAGGGVIFSLMKLILTDRRWDLAQVGLVAGSGASLCVLIGSLLAGFALSRFRLLSVLCWGLVSILAASLLWLAFTLNALPLTTVAVWLATGVASLGIGVVSVVCFNIFMVHARRGNQPATDFSICQSIQTFGSILFPALGTAISQWGGYPVGVGFGVLLLLLALGVIYRQRHTFARTHGQSCPATE